MGILRAHSEIHCFLYDVAKHNEFLSVCGIQNPDLVLLCLKYHPYVWLIFSKFYADLKDFNLLIIPVIINHSSSLFSS